MNTFLEYVIGPLLQLSLSLCAILHSDFVS